MLNTPVLFIVFNRPETTVQVFEAIRKARPKQLFVAADGPRAGKEGEKERCEEARRIATNVDWDCELKTLFREENIGCGRGPAEAITWFFEQVEQGIILEDDCLPAQSFFKFSEELLNRYSNDQVVQMIAGANLLEDWDSCKDSYLFSTKGGMWGWSTWRRAWNKFDYFVGPLRKERIQKLFFQNISNPGERKVYFDALMQAVNNPETITFWDYQWVFSRLYNGQITIVPKINMIKNIGFGENATHTYDKESRLAKLRIDDIEFPLAHPEGFIIDREYDEFHSKSFYPVELKTSLFKRIFSRIN